MSPPLAATETQDDAKSPGRRKKRMTPKAIEASRRNGKLSRGPITDEGKRRTRLNACKHNHRAELPILPGEDEDELKRRLEVWPQILGAETEIERLEAVQAVHMGWRRARSLRSDDADAEKRMIAIKKAHVDQQAEEARLLGLELDSDVDPQGVVRKLHRTPAGCNLLLNEFKCLSDCINKYKILFWSRRERLFHCLGKRLRDLFTDDRVITDWVVALMGAVFGDGAPEEKLQSISEVLEGLRPPWMDVVEYQIRLEHLVVAVPGREESKERVKSYVAAAISDLKVRLKRAQARARRALKLELESAWVDDTVAGARRLNYRLGHNRSYDAAFRRLEKLQKERRAGGGSPEDDPEDGTEPDETSAPEASPAVETSPVATNDPSSAPVANDPVSPLTNECLPPSPEPQTPGPVPPPGSVSNEPILAASHDGDGIGACGSAVDITVHSSASSAPTEVNDPPPAEADDRLESVTNEPVSRLTSEPLPPCPNAPAEKHEIRNPKSEPNPPEPQTPGPVRPPEAGAGGQRGGEPPPERPPGLRPGYAIAAPGATATSIHLLN